MTALVITELRHSFGFVVSEEEPGLRSRDQVTLLQQTYATPPLFSQAGTILGQVEVGTSGTYAANAGNTGTFTCGAIVLNQGVIEGTYRGEFIAATKYNVYDPDGLFLGEGTTGVAFAGQEPNLGNEAFPEGGTPLTFTITAGGAPAAVGDGFTIAIAANANVGLYNVLSLTAGDGTQIPSAILGNTLDASGGNTKVAVMSRACEVNGSELIYPAGATANQIAAINAQLKSVGIIVR